MKQLVFDEDIYNTIRRNIKKYRKQRGLTAAELAERIGRHMTLCDRLRAKRLPTISAWIPFIEFL